MIANARYITFIFTRIKKYVAQKCKRELIFLILIHYLVHIKRFSKKVLPFLIKRNIKVKFPQFYLFLQKDMLLDTTQSSVQ